MKVLAKKLHSLTFSPFHVYDVCVLCMYECLYTRLRVCGSACVCVKLLMHMCGYSKPGADTKNLPGWLILPFEAGLSAKPRVSQLVLLSSLWLSPSLPSGSVILSKAGKNVYICVYTCVCFIRPLASVGSGF